MSGLNVLKSLKELLGKFFDPLTKVKDLVFNFPKQFLKLAKQITSMPLSDFVAHFAKNAYKGVKDFVKNILFQLVKDVAKHTIGVNISCLAGCISCCLDGIVRGMERAFEGLCEELKTIVEHCAKQVGRFTRHFMNAVKELNQVGVERVDEGMESIVDLVKHVPDFFERSFEDVGRIIGDITKIRGVRSFKRVLDDVVKFKDTIMEMIQKMLAPLGVLVKLLADIGKIIVKLIAKEVKEVVLVFVDSLRTVNRFVQGAGDRIQTLMTPPSWASCFILLDNDAMDAVRELFADIQDAIDMERVCNAIEDSLEFIEGSEGLVDLVIGIHEKLIGSVKKCKDFVFHLTGLSHVIEFIGKEVQLITRAARLGILLGHDIGKVGIAMVKNLEQFSVKMVDREMERVVEHARMVKDLTGEIGEECFTVMKDGVEMIQDTGKELKKGVEDLSEDVVIELKDMGQKAFLKVDSFRKDVHKKAEENFSALGKDLGKALGGPFKGMFARKKKYAKKLSPDEEEIQMLMEKLKRENMRIEDQKKKVLNSILRKRKVKVATAWGKLRLGVVGGSGGKGSVVAKTKVKNEEITIEVNDDGGCRSLLDAMKTQKLVEDLKNSQGDVMEVVRSRFADIFKRKKENQFRKQIEGMKSQLENENRKLEDEQQRVMKSILIRKKKAKEEKERKEREARRPRKVMRSMGSDMYKQTSEDIESVKTAVTGAFSGLFGMKKKHHEEKKKGPDENEIEELRKKLEKENRRIHDEKKRVLTSIVKKRKAKAGNIWKKVQSGVDKDDDNEGMKDQMNKIRTQQLVEELKDEEKDVMDVVKSRFQGIFQKKKEARFRVELEEIKKKLEMENERLEEQKQNVLKSVITKKKKNENPKPKPKPKEEEKKVEVVVDKKKKASNLWDKLQSGVVTSDEGEKKNMKKKEEDDGFVLVDDVNKESRDEEKKVIGEGIREEIQKMKTQKLVEELKEKDTMEVVKSRFSHIFKRNREVKFQKELNGFKEMMEKENERLEEEREKALQKVFQGKKDRKKRVRGGILKKIKKDIGERKKEGEEEQKRRRREEEEKKKKEEAERRRREEEEKKKKKEEEAEKKRREEEVRKRKEEEEERKRKEEEEEAKKKKNEKPPEDEELKKIWEELDQENKRIEEEKKKKKEEEEEMKRLMAMLEAQNKKFEEERGKAMKKKRKK